MTTFFTSDTHFCHENIIRYCNRPFGSVEHMNEALVANWNLVVGRHDDVWHLGDVSFGTPEQTHEILGRLNGRLHFVVGNHDRKGRAEKTNWAGFGQVHGDYVRLKIDGYKFVLCHFPFHAWERGWINLHGHTHGTYPSRWGQHDVGVDVNGYAPISVADAAARACAAEKPRALY